MDASDVIELLKKHIPSAENSHMWRWHMAHAAQGRITHFISRLAGALSTVDDAIPGYADEMVARIRGVAGTGNPQFESLLQISSEIYVTVGAVESADRVASGKAIIKHEPAKKDSKNPEFSSVAAGVPYAMEVKAPSLLTYRQKVGQAKVQVVARGPREFTTLDPNTVLPRDNPMKDFLVSANQKFAAFTDIDAAAFRLLYVVWDDYCQEAITALLSPLSGLLTDNSFNRQDDAPVTYPLVDGIIIDRHQASLRNGMRDEQPVDAGAFPFRYHGVAFPPKVYVQNPTGRAVPAKLLERLSVVPIESQLGAEYRPQELIFWIDLPS